jgi:hypothetical protein
MLVLVQISLELKFHLVDSIPLPVPFQPASKQENRLGQPVLFSHVKAKDGLYLIVASISLQEALQYNLV